MPPTGAKISSSWRKISHDCRLTSLKSKQTASCVNYAAVSNSKIMAIKRRACGYRNREHFKTAIYFFCGGLDLYPKHA